MTQADKVPQDVVDIIHAIDATDHSELTRLLEAGAKPTPKGSPLSPLRAAITHFRDGKLVCDATALKLLLDHGADPNFVDQYSGFAPLENALSMGDIECSRLLKGAGADVNRHGKSGQSMLQFAVKGALRTADTSILNLVLSWGVNPNALDADGSAYTALHEAAGTTPGQDPAPVIAELLRSGANPCITDSHGATAWDVANTLKGVIPEITGQAASKITTNLEKITAAQKLLADAMGACPPTGTGRYYERPSFFENLVGKE